MKYELWGLVLVVIGALVAAGTAGIDTGNIGLSLDDILHMPSVRVGCL